jgi:hypothetical protein
MGIVMSDLMFIASIGRDALYIRVANRSDKPFTLDCNLDRRGSHAYLELPRHYQTLRGTKAAAAKLFGGGLEWRVPEAAAGKIDRVADDECNISSDDLPLEHDHSGVTPPLTPTNAVLDRACEDFKHYIKYILEPAKVDLEEKVRKNEISPPPSVRGKPDFGSQRRLLAGGAGGRRDNRNTKRIGRNVRC